MIFTTLLLAEACATCGTERWDVKVLADPPAARLSYTPVRATVAQLAALPRSSRRARTAPVEFTLYRVLACLRLVKDERDEDLHLVISEPADPAVTMIAEIPNPQCAGACRNVVNAAKYAQARRTVAGLQPPVLVELTGFGFFDIPHGQIGLAPNAIELHPVLRVEAKGVCPR